MSPSGVVMRTEKRPLLIRLSESAGSPRWKTISPRANVRRRAIVSSACSASSGTSASSCHSTMCDEFDTSSVAAANDTDLRASYGVVMTTNTKGGVMKLKSSRRLVARLGLALAVAAIAAPGAQAMTMNAMNESGGGARLYADDLHAPLAVATLPPSNVRTDAASPQPIVSSSNVRTDAASSRPSPVRVSSFASNIRTDAASSVALTDARHSALLKQRAQLGQVADTVRVDSTSIDRLAEHQLGRCRNRSGPRSARPDAPVQRRLLRRTTQPQRSARRHMSREPTGRKRAFQGWPAYGCPGALCPPGAMQDN